METNNIVPLSVTISNNDVIVIVNGDATMKISHILKKFVIDLMNESVGEDRFFKIDLKNCSYMDSTFTGILIILEKYAQKKLNGRFELLNPSSFCKKLLDTMGLVPLFKISTNNNNYKGEAIQLQSFQIQKLEKAILIYMTHKALADINKDNEKEFEDVLKFLRESIKKDIGKDIDELNLNIENNPFGDDIIKE